MVASFTSIAAERGIRTDQARDHSQLLRMLWTELDAETDPLLVFDNAGDPAAIRPYLPPLGQVKILVTSRSAAWGSLGAGLQIGPFTDEESAAFLVLRTGLADRETARRLAADLGNLPLACAQARAFIRSTPDAAGGPLLRRLLDEGSADPYWPGPHAPDQRGRYLEPDPLDTLVLYNQRALLVIDRNGGRITNVFNRSGDRASP